MEKREIKIKVPEDEIWLDIKNYESYYQVSNKGRVRSLPHLVNTSIKHNSQVLRKGRILKTIPNDKGYLSVSLSKSGKSKCYRVHVLVAKTFIPNPVNKPFVDHIDTDKSNNNVDNLRWCTQKENCNNDLTIEHYRSNNMGKNNPMFGKTQTIEHKIKRSRAVLQFSKNNEFIKEYDAIFLAAKETGALVTNIIRACKNFNKTAGGYKWKYKTIK